MNESHKLEVQFILNYLERGIFTTESSLASIVDIMEKSSRESEFNINCVVKAKVTDYGWRIHKENHHLKFSHVQPPLKYIKPDIDKQGYSNWQLWELFKEFGSKISTYGEMPFDTVILIETNPHERDEKKQAPCNYTDANFFSDKSPVQFVKLNGRSSLIHLHLTECGKLVATQTEERIMSCPYCERPVNLV